MTSPKPPDLFAPPRPKPPGHKRKPPASRIPSRREFRAALALYAPGRVAEAEHEGEQEEGEIR